MEFSATPSQSQILHDSRRSFALDRPTFVITHGMGGTKTGDRFHQLADAICKAMPECNVLLIDWSKQSWRTGWLGIPNPLAVAQNIDPVATEASRLLKTLQIDPGQTTFIGESFGSCVNARIAEAFGGRGRILAFNPPNDAGGYKTPDLRACSDVAWSFQTYSMFDTQDSIADCDIFLQTSPSSSNMDQHVAGVTWLAERMRSGDIAWLLTSHKISKQQAEYFDAIGSLSGELIRKEIWAHIISYNLIRAMIAQSAMKHGIEPRTISFKGAVQTLIAFQTLLEANCSDRNKHRIKIHRQVLDAIAMHRVGNRPDRFEPRLRKRRDGAYDLLTKPRHIAKSEIQQQLMH